VKGYKGRTAWISRIHIMDVNGWTWIKGMDKMG
jgi:hypothetical protein